MTNELQDDPAFAALTAARPTPLAEIDSSTAPAAQQLLADILAAAPKPSPRRSRRVRITAGAMTMAAAITVAVVVVNSVGVDHGHVVVAQPSAAADVTAIARASTSAFSSGRAEMTFAGRQGRITERGTAQIAFSGLNLDVATSFDAANGNPGFDAHNKTVDGQFYLFDGVPGAKKWYHDTTATPTGSGIFDLDPRGLLAVLRPAAAFVVVGTESTPAGLVRHLRATQLGALPSLHLVLGPVAGRDITSLDLWVGADDTVQRLALTAKHTDTAEPCFTQNGVKQCLKPGGQLKRDKNGITIVPGPSGGAPIAPSVTTAAFTVRFTDVGTPISIVAPPNAINVAGKG